MRSRPRWLLAVLTLAQLGCSQAFRFTEDGGAPVDAGPPDGGLDAGSDAGCTVPGECECQDAGDCSGARPHCAADHKCVECAVGADCGLNGACDPITRRCTTACSSGLDCDGGVRNRCGNDPPRHCISCDDNPTCLQPALPICADSVGFCVQCARDSHCDGGYCDTRFGTCVQCQSTAQCALTEFCRLATGACEVRP